jgi:hypothetical protein
VPGVVVAAGSRVRLDLNGPEFQDVFFRLDSAELKQAVASSGHPAGGSP